MSMRYEIGIIVVYDSMPDKEWLLLSKSDSDEIYNFVNIFDQNETWESSYGSPMHKQKILKLYIKDAKNTVINNSI